MIEELFRIFDEHFIGKMQMFNGRELVNERMYQDDYITMIISSEHQMAVTELKTQGGIILTPNQKAYIRVVIRNWQTGQSFSKNISIDKFIEKTPDEVIDTIRNEVWSNSGVASRTLLIDWYEKKKVDLRDKKLGSLGI